MEYNYKIYLICFYNGQPLDFLLPVYTDAEFAGIHEVAGTCFKIYEPKNAEILLACRKNDELITTRINIETACKANTNISFSIVLKKDRKTAFLRAYTDEQCNSFYPIPNEFLELSI